MKKNTTIRMNKCDREIRFFVYLSFMLYMALQLFARASSDDSTLKWANLLLYFVFVPGFMFAVGYQYQMLREHGSQILRRWLLSQGLRYLICFVVLAFLQEVIHSNAPAANTAAHIMMLYTVPSVSAVFLSLAVMMLFLCAFDEFFQGIWKSGKKTGILVAACVLSVALRSKTDSYSVISVLFGSDMNAAVPVVPYFIYFLAGMFAAGVSGGFNLKVSLTLAVVSVVSLVLYRTPLENLCRVAISAFPMYVLYLVSLLTTDLTARFKAIKAMADRSEIVFYVYSACAFLLCHLGLLQEGTLLKSIAAGALLIVLSYVLVFGYGWYTVLYEKIVSWFRIKARRKVLLFYLAYTAIFAVLLLGVFLDFIRYDKTFIVKGDGLSQYYAKALYYNRYMRNLIGGLIHGNFELPMYDFRIGLGAEITYIMEPLYFLFALFKESHIELAYDMVTLIRFYLTGLASSAMLLYFGKDFFAAFVGSLVYTFGGFALFAGICHTMFMIPLIMLPLMIIAMEEIIRGKRWYLMPPLVAVSLFSNYYFLYMNTIALGIYFVVRFLCQQDRQKRTFLQFFKKGLVITGTYILGTAMSCTVLATNFGMYLGSGRSGDVRIKTPSLFFYSKEWITRCFITFITIKNAPGEWLKYGFIPIAMFAILVLFMRKGRKELKIFSLMAVACSLFPVCGFVFSGFSAVHNRWCYLAALLVGYIVADCLDDLYQLKKREAAASVALILVYGWLVYFGDILSTKYTKIAFTCLVITFIVITLCQKANRRISEIRRQSIMFLLVVGMIIEQGHVFYGTGGSVNGYADKGVAQSVLENTPLTAVKEMEDDSFYRVFTPKFAYYTSSSPYIMDYHGLTNICSTYNSNIMNYLKQLGGTSYSMTQLLGLGNNALMNTLACVKYYATYGEKSGKTLPPYCNEVRKTTANGKDVTIYQAEHYLPLGYTYEEAISEEELEQYGLIERQEIMLQKAVTAGIENTGNTDDILCDTVKLDIKSKSENGLYLNEHSLTSFKESDEEEDENAALSSEELQDEEEEANTSSKASLKLEFDGKKNAETFIVMRNAYMEGDISEASPNLTITSKDNKVSYKFASTTYRYGTGQKDYIFNLGYHEKALKSCKISVKSKCDIQFDSFEIYSVPMNHLGERVNALKEDVLENIQMETNKVSGTIHLDKDKILALSIPYQKGWTAYVDGEEQTIEKINYMYMGLPLTRGDHTIELRFAIPYLDYCLMILPAAWALYILMVLISWIISSRKKKAARAAQSSDENNMEQEQ